MLTPRRDTIKTRQEEKTATTAIRELTDDHLFPVTTTSNPLVTVLRLPQATSTIRQPSTSNFTLAVRSLEQNGIPRLIVMVECQFRLNLSLLNITTINRGGLAIHKLVEMSSLIKHLQDPLHRFALSRQRTTLRISLIQLPPIPSLLLPTIPTLRILPTLPILLSNLKLDLPTLPLFTPTNTPLPHLPCLILPILLQAPLLPLNNMLILLPLSITMVKVLTTGSQAVGSSRPKKVNSYNLYARFETTLYIVRLALTARSFSLSSSSRFQLSAENVGKRSNRFLPLRFNSPLSLLPLSISLD